MAFQTNVFRDGQWITETIDLQAALKASAVLRPASDPLPETPVCGILSQTIVESPVVHWVLPVRLRSREQNDIAFVGDHFVQISELQRDGQVHSVLRKSDFGSKIRKAVVIGDSLEHGLEDDGPPNVMSSESQSDFGQSQSAQIEDLRPRHLPPQLLVLMLETGQLLFLFIHGGPDQSLEFFIAKYDSPTSLLYLGYHLASDPSSRYIAAASPDGVLVVYELESLAELNGQYGRHEPLRPVKSVRVRAIQAVIHKLEFLFPRLEDDYHIILIMIVVRKEGDPGTPVSRMITYEWENGDNLQFVFAAEKKGHRLPREHTMPVLLIPIRFNTSFFAVSSHFIGVVKHALSGSPEFELLPNDSPAPSELHFGTHEPLWTAWARPFRRKKYFEKTDIIYLAREDGVVIYLEIDANEMFPSVTSVGCLQTNIDTAFTTAFDVFSDILITGGDSGPGGIWKLAPRSELEQVNSLPNWSPVVDVTATNEHSAWGPSAMEMPSIQAKQSALPNNLRKSDDIFSASGRGQRGNITHWRWGIQARIGLDIEIGEPLRQAWAFTIDHADGTTSLCGLLALPHSSLVLQFSEDLGYVEPLSSERTSFDITSRTLHAVEVSKTIVQVTETSINIVTPTETSRCLLAEALDTPGVVAEHASSIGHIVVLSTHLESYSKLHVMQAEGIQFSRLSSWDAKGEITCISIFTTSADHFVVAASIFEGTPLVSIYSLTGTLLIDRPFVLEHESPGGLSRFEAITSIISICPTSEKVDLVLGSRFGRLLTLRIDKEFDKQSLDIEAVGVAHVDVLPARSGVDDKPTILVCCDDRLILMTDFSDRDCRFERRHYVWPTDSNDASLPSPPIHSCFQIPHSLSGDAIYMSLMILSGSRLLLADVSGTQVGQVPRSLPLHGTPTRVIFSSTLKCLVVAMLDGNRPTLAFVDSETGALISQPTDREKAQTAFISGLGTPGDRIYGLNEWQYVKDGKTFFFILVATKDGKLIIVSTEKGDSRRNGRPIKYWTRYKKDHKKPIYSIVGFPQGLLYCVDRTLHWDILDLMERRLKPVKQFVLDSPAMTLRVVDEKIFALTTMHSLEVIEPPTAERAEMALLHTDQVSRRAVHMVDIGDASDDDLGHWPLTLISDQRGGIVGIWIPWGRKNQELEVVFEGTLPFSVRRFVRANIRPAWRSRVTRGYYGIVPSTVDGTDIVGVSMGGSMIRFTLLSLDLWRVLSLIQNLARGSAAVSPLSHGQTSEAANAMDIEPTAHPKAMHIDGDLLQRCLALQVLEQVVGTGPSAALFGTYLDALEGGRYTDAFRDLEDAERREQYLKLGYRILEYLVAPIV